MNSRTSTTTRLGMGRPVPRPPARRVSALVAPPSSSASSCVAGSRRAGSTCAETGTGECGAGSAEVQANTASGCLLSSPHSAVAQQRGAKRVCLHQANTVATHRVPPRGDGQDHDFLVPDERLKHLAARRHGQIGQGRHKEGDGGAWEELHTQAGSCHSWQASPFRPSRLGPPRRRPTWRSRTTDAW